MSNTVHESVEEFPIKTEEEILFKLKDDSFSDLLGFRSQVLIQSLPFKSAREFLKKECKEKDWGVELTRDVVTKSMLSYLDFAWGKVIDHRGISASRSVQKIGEWLWILGDQVAYNFVNDDKNYKNYGAPALMFVTLRYKVFPPNGERIKRMAKGLSCCLECDEGCCT